MTYEPKPAKKNPEPRTKNPSANGGYSYRNLIVWQKAQDLTVQVVRQAAAFPRSRIAEIVTDQIMRSSSSVGANIAEGHGRFSLGAHANYLSIAKASACETDNFLDLCRRLELMSREVESKLHADCTEVIRMLTAKILDLGRLQKAGKPNSLGEEPAIYSAHDYTQQEPGSRFSVLGSPEVP